MDQLQFDLTYLANRVSVILENGVYGVRANPEGGVVWASNRVLNLIEAIREQKSIFQGSSWDIAFVQFALFSLFSEGSLSKLVAYDRVLDKRQKNFCPRVVSLILTKLCNFQCPHCYNDSGHRHSDEMSYEQKVGLVDYLGRWGVRELVLSGGEPTLDPSLPEVISLATKYRMVIKITTNAWEIPLSLIHGIKSNTIRQVNVSLDGATAEIHDRFRRRAGSFDRLINNVCKLRDAGLSNIVINACIHRDSLPQMEAILQIALRLSCPRIAFKAVLYSGRPSERAQGVILTNDEVALFHRRRDELAMRYGADIKIEGYLITSDVPNELLDEVSCNAGNLSMMIDANGDMLPCEIIGGHSRTVNLRAMAPIQAWTMGSTFTQFRIIKSEISVKGGCMTRGCPGCSISAQPPSVPSQESL